MTFVVIIGMFSACSKSKAVEGGKPFEVYRNSDGLVIKLGDKRADIEKLLGPDEHFVVEFEDDIERVDYWDNDEVKMDYDLEGTVRALRFVDKKWKIFNGLSVGDSAKTVEKQYPAEFVHKYPSTESIWIAYDKDGNMIEFSEKAPHIVRFSIKDGIVTQIVVQDNTAREGIF